MKKLFLITFFIMGLFLFAKHTNVYAMVCCDESNCTNCGESPTATEVPQATTPPACVPSQTCSGWSTCTKTCGGGDHWRQCNNGCGDYWDDSDSCNDQPCDCRSTGCSGGGNCTSDAGVWSCLYPTVPPTVTSGPSCSQFETTCGSHCCSDAEECIGGECINPTATPVVPVPTSIPSSDHPCKDGYTCRLDFVTCAGGYTNWPSCLIGACCPEVPITPTPFPNGVYCNHPAQCSSGCCNDMGQIGFQCGTCPTATPSPSPTPRLTGPGSGYLCELNGGNCSLLPCTTGWVNSNSAGMDCLVGSCCKNPPTPIPLPTCDWPNAVCGDGKCCEESCVNPNPNQPYNTYTVCPSGSVITPTIVVTPAIIDECSPEGKTACSAEGKEINCFKTYATDPPHLQWSIDGKACPNGCDESTGKCKNSTPNTPVPSTVTPAVGGPSSCSVNGVNGSCGNTCDVHERAVGWQVGGCVNTYCCVPKTNVPTVIPLPTLTTAPGQPTPTTIPTEEHCAYWCANDNQCVAGFTKLTRPAGGWDCTVKTDVCCKSNTVVPTSGQPGATNTPVSATNTPMPTATPTPQCGKANLYLEPLTRNYNVGDDVNVALKMIAPACNATDPVNQGISGVNLVFNYNESAVVINPMNFTKPLQTEDWSYPFVNINKETKILELGMAYVKADTKGYLGFLTDTKTLMTLGGKAAANGTITIALDLSKSSVLTKNSVNVLLQQGLNGTYIVGAGNRAGLTFKVKLQGVGGKSIDVINDVQLKIKGTTNSTTTSINKIKSECVADAALCTYTGTVYFDTEGAKEFLVTGSSHLQRNMGSVTLIKGQTVNAPESWIALNKILLSGDADRNNTIDMVNDFEIWKSAYYAYQANQATGWQQYNGDFNKDGKIDMVNDFEIWKLNFFNNKSGEN